MEFEGNICPLHKIFGNVFPSAFAPGAKFLQWFGAGFYSSMGETWLWMRTRPAKVSITGRSRALIPCHCPRNVILRIAHPFPTLEFPSSWWEYPNSPFSLYPDAALLETSFQSHNPRGRMGIFRESLCAIWGHFKQQIDFLSTPIPLFLIPSFQQGR